MKTYQYRASNLKSTITFLALVSIVEVHFWCPLKTVISCDLFIIIIIIFINFFRRVSPNVLKRSYITSTTITNFPVICAFIIGFTVMWTKMRSLAGSLADGVLADVILIPPRPPIPPTNTMIVRGPRKSTETSKRKNIY